MSVAENGSPSGAVVLEGLRRQFGEKVAVENVDLVIPQGSFFGIVGPNGAGKTTTMKMATGLLRPTAGRASVAGIDVWGDLAGAKARMGVLPEELRLFERLTGRELLAYSGLLRRMDPAVTEPRAAELLDVLGLADAADVMVVDYSQGMRKKVGLACALLHAPSVLFLDEPFESVDPVSARTVTDVLKSLAARGSTVVFSSHVMDLVQRLCDHVAIFHQGRVVASGPTVEVRGERTLEDVFIDLVGAAPAQDGRLEWLGPS